METVKGYVKHYVFHNETNSYSIAKLKTEEDRQVTIVGYFPRLGEDVLYEFTGDWVTHSQYGEQLKVDTFKKNEIQSEEGLISYLSSPFFHGIGPKTAGKIVTTFGPDVIKKIIDNKKILKEIGLSAVKIEKFYRQLLDNQTNEHILVALYGYHISGKLAMKLLNKYSHFTMEKLEENPYQLVDDIEGIGFIKADEIAKKLGIEKDDLRRIKASISYAMQYIAYPNGDVYLTYEQILNYANQVLGFEANLDEAIAALIDEKRIINEDDRYYLTLSYKIEVELAEKIKALMNNESFKVDQNYIETLIDAVEIKKGMQYTSVQKEAIKTSLIQPLAIITGGPGTGKTTIIDGLLEVYRLYYNLNLKSSTIMEDIALMAPTGRAAKRMKELLNLEAKTIHRQLGYNFEGMFAFDQSNRLPQKLLIIDEASMIDIFLAHRLFSAIDDHAQVIIVGDVDQLPSVGPGQVLSDLIESKVIPVVRLDEIHRQAKDSQIINLARAVNMQILDENNLVTQNDVYLFQTRADKIKEVVVNQLEGALRKGYSMIEDIQILIPMYKGDLGIDSFNQLLQKTFNGQRTHGMSFGDKTFYVGDKVIQLVNDPERLIMNGDIGIVKDIRNNQEDEQILIVKFDDNEVMYNKSDLDELNLAYAISIHKSQGSEYKIVMIPMAKSYMHMLKKELIYTALTRAKQYLIMLGDMSLLKYAANNLSEKRQTTLRLRLKEDLEIIAHEDDYSPYDFM